MKMLGTERWCVISSNASWIAAPSSERTGRKALHQPPTDELTPIIRQEESLRTNLVQLNGVIICSHLAQQTLRCMAVRTVRLGENGDSMIVNDFLCLSLGGHEGIRARWARGAEKGT